VLSYLANSRHVAYLDDDNWWGHGHLSSLLSAVEGQDYAYSHRWFVDAATLQPLAIDHWESVGPDAGVFRDRFGGFVDPNTLMIDKVRCEPVLRWWMVPADAHRGLAADRNVFDALRRHHQGRSTGRPSCYYVMNPDDQRHPWRLKTFARQGAAAGRPR
jgi:hypothetical protein